MTERARQLLEQALKLPTTERADLAALLLESLDEGADDPAQVEQAWREEIARRVRDLQEGRVKPIHADEVFARARDALASQRARRRA
jgi:putative addiction module component (TIGR02574 family)